MIRTYTDYPITELGDIEGQDAPIRECRVISYDGDKYCTVAVSGVVAVVKAGYVYFNPRRIEDDDVRPICGSWFLWWKGIAS